jgi:hypothetical protein
MSSRSTYLRNAADQCRWEASKIGDAERQAELLKLAAEYIAKATDIETAKINPPERLPETSSCPTHFSDDPPRFSFAQGRFSKPGLTTELPDTHALHKEAVAMFIGLVRDIADELATHPEWEMEVIDEIGKPIFRLKVIGESLA